MATTETVSARDLDTRQRIIMAVNGPPRDWLVYAISNATFAGKLVARTLYLRADDGTREEASVNPDDPVTRVLEEPS